MAKALKYPNLKAIMAKNGINQDELAELININKSTLSKKITGKVDFTSTEMFQIKEIFQCDLDHIFLQSQSPN